MWLETTYLKSLRIPQRWYTIAGKTALKVNLVILLLIGDGFIVGFEQIAYYHGTWKCVRYRGSRKLLNTTVLKPTQVDLFNKLRVKGKSTK